MNAKPLSSQKVRDLDRSRKEILEAAFMEIYALGFQGVSVDEIVAKTKLTKGAFYHHFPSKLEMGYALVDEVIRPMIIDRWIRPLDAYENPLDGILFQVKFLIGDSDSVHLKLGCPLNNLVQEMSPIDPGFHKRLKYALNFWVDEMEKQLKRAKKSGYLRPEINTKQVAHFVVMNLEGFFGMLKCLDDPKLFIVLFTSLKRYFKTLES